MTFGGTLSEKPRNATTQWHRPSVCKVPRLGVTFVFSVIFAGSKLIGMCFPLKCDFWEFYGFAKGGCCGSRDCCARRGRRLTRMSLGLTLNGGTLVAQNRDERRDKGRENFLLSFFFPHAFLSSQIVSTTSIY
jgi:hypothetical protein